MNIEEKILKPKKGLKVRVPSSMMLLREAGQKVPMTRYWKRRLLDGDVEEVGSKKEIKKEEPIAKVVKKSSSKKKNESIEGDEL